MNCKCRKHAKCSDCIERDGNIKPQPPAVFKCNIDESGGMRDAS
jgi:hypothetical protein